MSVACFMPSILPEASTSRNLFFRKYPTQLAVLY
jgi:hypothetical protein